MLPPSDTAQKLYPVRVRVLNALTDEAEWYTFAYIPHIPTEKAFGGAERSRLRRMELLQRMLYLAFDTTNAASHSGIDAPGGSHGPLCAFPRIFLYLCDQPEKRAVLCLKIGMCHRPCSVCEVTVAQLGTAEALHANDLCPVGTAEKQMEAHGHRVHGRESTRRTKTEREASINRQAPALAAMAALCTPHYLLVKIIGRDVLDVH